LYKVGQEASREVLKVDLLVEDEACLDPSQVLEVDLKVQAEEEHQCQETHLKIIQDLVPRAWVAILHRAVEWHGSLVLHLNLVHLKVVEEV